MIAAALFAFWIAAQPQTAAAAQAPQTQPSAASAAKVADPNVIESLEIRGNRIRSDTIRVNMRTKKGEALNPDVVARDIKALYALGWFDDIYVEEEPGDRGGKNVIFYFKEKPTIRSIEFTGISTINKSDILTELRKKKVGLSTDKPFDVTEVRHAEKVIKGMLAEKGKQDATIEYHADPLGLSVPPTSVSLVFDVDEGPTVRIAAIEIEGNKVFKDSDILGVFKLQKESGPFTIFGGKDKYYDLKLQDDITRIRMFLADHGYARANVLEPKVELKPTLVHRTLPFIRPSFPWGIPLPFWAKLVDRYYITINLEENDQYRVGELKIKGNKVVPEEKIRQELNIKPGDIYNDSLMRQGMERLKKYYGTGGYINFSPNREHDFDDAKKLVNLTIDIDEGKQYRVNRITFSGNTTTRDKVIRREFLLTEGDLFNSQRLDYSLLRLNQLGYFDEIKEQDADLKFNQRTDEVDINVKVKEKGKNTIGVNGGVSGIGGGFVGMTYETNNFLGRGNALQLNVQGGAQQSTFVFSYSEPYMFDRPLSMGVSIYGQSYQYDQAREILGLDPKNLPAGLGFDNRLNYRQNRRGFTASSGYPLRLFKGFSKVGLLYQFENSDTNAVNPATDEYFRGVALAQRESFSTNTSADFGISHSRKLVPSFSMNTKDSAFFPTSGRSVGLSFEYTGGILGGNVDTIRPMFQFEYYRPHTRHRNVLAMRFLASFITGFSGMTTPFYERTYGGGDYDLRGFDFRTLTPVSFITRYLDALDAETGAFIKKPYDDIVQVGGDTQAILNLEYRIPLVGPTITLVPYLDAGNIWAIRKSQLLREIADTGSSPQIETATFMPGTNSGIRMSMGVEIQVIVPVINAPVRFIWAVNPIALNNIYLGPVTGTPFQISQKRHDFKFTVGRTF